ncbi:MAG: ATP-binding protein [Nitrospira sp.]
MSHMYILRGGPGAGKSYYAGQLMTFSDTPLIVCSADEFFMDADGVYRFDPAWLGRAHGACLKKAVLAMVERQNIIVDNTNAGPDEMLPYLALCQAFGYACEVIKVLCDREVAWGRQSHDVPRKKFDEIHSTIEQSRVPKIYRGAPWLTEREVGRPSCNCGKGMGIRPDHEAECASAYIRHKK